MWEFYNEREVKARKPYVCEEAGCEIAVGDRYSYGAGKVGGDFVDQRLCRECRFLAEVMIEEFGWDDGFMLGELRSELRDEVGPDVDPIVWAIRTRAGQTKRLSLEWALHPRAQAALRSFEVLIWSGEEGAWWRADRPSYTVNRDEAGIYNFGLAVSATRGSGAEKRICFEVAPGPTECPLAPIAALNALVDKPADREAWFWVCFLAAAITAAMGCMLLLATAIRAGAGGM